MLQAILEYQKKDGELRALEKEIADSKAKKVVNQMVGVVKNAQQKIVDIEKNGSNLIEEYNKLCKEFTEQSKTVENLSKTKLDGLSKQELVDLEKKIAELSANLLVAQKEINKLSKQISKELSEFEKTKTEVVEAKKRHTQGMSAYNLLVESRQEQIDKLKSELLSLEKKADPKLLAKYKKMRQDKIYPVFVPLLNHSCGGCSMELALSQRNKIDEKGILECENCHRIIYKK